MEIDLIQIVIQGGAVGLMGLMMWINHKERIKNSDYLREKNGQLERQSVANIDILERQSEHFEKALKGQSENFEKALKAVLGQLKSELRTDREIQEEKHRETINAIENKK